VGIILLELGKMPMLTLTQGGFGMALDIYGNTGNTWKLPLRIKAWCIPQESLAASYTFLSPGSTLRWHFFQVCFADLRDTVRKTTIFREVIMFLHGVAVGHITMIEWNTWEIDKHPGATPKETYHGYRNNLMHQNKKYWTFIMVHWKQSNATENSAFRVWRMT
jgi:hypothetical protein